LAHGAFGVVHLVNKKDDDSKKFVSKKIDLNRINLEQAMIEVNLLKNLNNPYIVKFEQFFHEEDFLIIVLEYCGDGDLS
jgi:NIMA (never in mitosis gene a)-related kinase